MLTFFLWAGRYLDHRTRAAARSAAQELSALEVPRALRVAADGTETEVPVAQLRLGDLVRVRPGGRMPVDGEIVEGRSELDRSLATLLARAETAGYAGTAYGPGEQQADLAAVRALIGGRS